MYIQEVIPTPTPSPTPTFTPTPTHTFTETPTITSTITSTETLEPTPTLSETPDDLYWEDGGFDPLQPMMGIKTFQRNVRNSRRRSF